VGKATALKEKKKRSHVRTGLRQKPLVPIGPGHTDIFHAARSLAVGSSSTVTRTAVIGYGTGFGSPRGRASWWAEEGREGSVTFFVVLPSGRFGYARGWAMGHVSAVGPWDTCRPSCDKIFICTSIFSLSFPVAHPYAVVSRTHLLRRATNFYNQNGTPRTNLLTGSISDV
jgi:hypothetical protein